MVRPGHVLVSLKATAVCGTDIGIYQGKVRIPYPRILGHESTGQVVEIGSAVTGVRPNDRIVLNPLIFCRSCYQCFAGKVNLCENGGLMGREADGTFAEFVVVPEYNVIKIPDSISYEEGTSLVALATVIQSHTKVKIVPGDVVAVIGQGAAGLMQTQMALLSGAGPVYAIARSRWKLDIAKGFGAMPVDAKEVNPVQAIMDATGGRGADLVIESVGSATTLRQAMDMVRPGGNVLFFGIAPASLDNFNGYTMYYKDMSLIGTRAMTPGDFYSAIKVVETGKLDIRTIISHRFELQDVKKALDLVDKTPGDALRVVVNI
ncbi:MAG: alcohol dehydrogenase catalytic domain-containing protein [Firmicutes bacterium]|nr:alcohol dehydrogenase catalytic domain-containing protein [Bacillota bacterium]